MKVELKHDTIVRHKQGEILDLPKEEAGRLIALGTASAVKEETKKTAKKK